MRNREIYKMSIPRAPRQPSMAEQIKGSFESESNLPAAAKHESDKGKKRPVGQGRNSKRNTKNLRHHQSIILIFT